jgi:hypothetical protein
MANKLIRHYGRDDLHFIAFSCYRSLPPLRLVCARKVLFDPSGSPAGFEIKKFFTA